MTANKDETLKGRQWWLRSFAVGTAVLSGAQLAGGLFLEITG